MRITLTIGAFFIVLGIIFGVAAFSHYRKAGRQWSIMARARRKIAIIFIIVGVVLIVWRITGG
jgi:uncharacterized membrane protein HdeD (DUF308 family)